MKHIFTFIFVVIIHLNFHFSSFSYAFSSSDITTNVVVSNDTKATNKVTSIISPNPAVDKAFLTFDNPNNSN